MGEGQKPATLDRWRFQAVHLNRQIGRMAINDITGPDITRAIEAIHAGRRRDTAARCLAMASQIFRWAVGLGLAARNPTADVVPLRYLLPKKDVKNHAALTEPTKVGGLMRAIAEYDGTPITRLALRLLALTFVRPGELRHAEWSELDGNLWRIPGERIKCGDPHLVPLSNQALAVLDELRPMTGSGRLVFPSERTLARPMSENTLNAALRRMGYAKDEMTSHGFRAMASTLLHEMGYPPMVIERQLAHTERNEVAASYNRAHLLPERERMMQAWADYLDGLAAGGNVVTLRR